MFNRRKLMQWLGLVPVAAVIGEQVEPVRMFETTDTIEPLLRKVVIELSMFPAFVEDADPDYESGITCNCHAELTITRENQIVTLGGRKHEVAGRRSGSITLSAVLGKTAAVEAFIERYGDITCERNMTVVGTCVGVGTCAEGRLTLSLPHVTLASVGRQASVHCPSRTVIKDVVLWFVPDDETEKQLSALVMASKVSVHATSDTTTYTAHKR